MIDTTLLNDEFFGLKVKLGEALHNSFDKYESVFNSIEQCFYHSVSELSKCIQKWLNKSSFFYINIRSLWAHFDALVQFIEEFNFYFEIIAITESWLSIDCEFLFHVKNYTLHFFPRPTGHGGEICVYVKTI